MVMSPPTRRTSPKTARSARSARAAATAAGSSHALRRPRSTWMSPGTCRNALVIDCAVASPSHASSRGRSSVAKGRISTLRTFTAGAAVAAGTGAVWAQAGAARHRGRTAAVRIVALARPTRVMTRSSLSLGRPETRRDTTEESGTDPSQPDLWHQHHGSGSKEPWPQVQGEARLPAILKEHVAGTSHGAATRQLRDLPEERLVDAQVPELLGIRYHQARQLGAYDLVALPLGHADEIYAFLRSREAPPIAAGADLLELDHVPLLVRRDHADLRVEEIDELALAVDGVDHDLARLVHARHRGHRVAARARAQRPARQLRPELVEVAPAQPEHAPLTLGVGGEGGRASEAVAPGGEERVLLMRHEHHLGVALERGRHVAAERRRFLPVDLLDRLVARRGDRGLEGLLHQGGLGGELRLQGEDARHRGTLVRVVEAPAAPLGDVDHEL